MFILHRIRKLTQTGYLDRLYKKHKWFNKVSDVVCNNADEEADENEEKRFGLNKVVSLFAIFGTGILVAILVLLFESVIIICSKHNHIVRIKKNLDR